MARLLLSKATLSKQRQLLQSYQRFLPSLDMKRQQLRAALKEVQGVGARLNADLNTLNSTVAKEIPMMANYRIHLDGLVTVKKVIVTEENVAGCKVPTLQNMDVSRSQLSPLGNPHWVGVVQEKLEQSLTLAVRLHIIGQQQKLLQTALTKITQRVNLFDKVLIPQTQSNIKKIQIYLGDRAREAVVTSKIAKRRRSANSALNDG